MRLYTEVSVHERVPCGAPDLAAEILNDLIGYRDRECFAVIHLDQRNHAIASEIVSIGTLTSALVHPREVFRAAIVNGAARIICGHNHPSGDLSPSPDDWSVTKRLRDAGNLLGIEVLDSLIVARGSHRSLMEEGHRCR